MADFSNDIIVGELKALAGLLSRFRIRETEEKKLQDSLGGIMTEHSWVVEREVRLTPEDIVDFVVSREGGCPIGVEVKCNFGLSEVTRQLHRYAQSTQVAGLLLVTTRRMHDHMPEAMRGKPLRVTVLPGGLIR